MNFSLFRGQPSQSISLLPANLTCVQHLDNCLFLTLDFIALIMFVGWLQQWWKNCCHWFLGLWERGLFLRSVTICKYVRLTFKEKNLCILSLIVYNSYKCLQIRVCNCVACEAWSTHRNHDSDGVIVGSNIIASIFARRSPPPPPPPPPWP